MSSWNCDVSPPKPYLDPAVSVNNCQLKAGKDWGGVAQQGKVKSFLGPRGPLRTPLMSVRCCPVVRNKNSGNLSLFFFRLQANSFPLSDSKLTQPLPQYTVHRTLNRIISRTFLAQFNLVCSGGFLLQPGVFLIKSFLLGPNLIV